MGKTEYADLRSKSDEIGHRLIVIQDIILDMASGVSEKLSWSLGPANSRLVRVLLYLMEGFVGGSILYLVLILGWALLEEDYWIIALISFLLFLPLLLERVAHYKEAQRQFESPPILQEWMKVREWQWTILGSVFVTGGLLGTAVLITDSAQLGVVTLFCGVIFGFFAVILASTGNVNSDTLTLTYNEKEVNLKFLEGAKQITFSNRTVLLVRFSSGYIPPASLFYIVPTRMANQVWSVFEAGLDADVEITNQSQVIDKQNLYLSFGFIGFGVVLSGFFYLMGVQLAISLVIGIPFMMIGLLILLPTLSGELGSQ